MYNLQDEFDDLMYSIPIRENMNLTSQRELQDFKERDFDRRLEALKVQALVVIADNFALRVNEELSGDLDN